jgi:hypothetical protein
VEGEEQVASSIHIQKGKSFTSHSVQADVVHILEHGKIKALIDFLMENLHEIGKGETESSEVPAAIIPVVLAKAVNEPNPENIEKILLEQGWPSKSAKELATDLSGQVARSTILLNEVEGDQTVQTTGRMMWLLQGKKRSWLFRFASTDDGASGAVYRVTSKDIVRHLTDFLN